MIGRFASCFWEDFWILPSHRISPSLSKTRPSRETTAVRILDAPARHCDSHWNSCSCMFWINIVFAFCNSCAVNLSIQIYGVANIGGLKIAIGSYMDLTTSSQYLVMSSWGRLAPFLRYPYSFDVALEANPPANDSRIPGLWNNCNFQSLLQKSPSTVCQQRWSLLDKIASALDQEVL